MPRRYDQDENAYDETDDRERRRRAVLDELEGPVASPAPVTTPEPSPGPDRGGPLPPSAPPPSYEPPAPPPTPAYDPSAPAPLPVDEPPATPGPVEAPPVGTSPFMEGAWPDTKPVRTPMPTWTPPPPSLAPLPVPTTNRGIPDVSQVATGGLNRADAVPGGPDRAGAAPSGGTKYDPYPGWDTDKLNSGHNSVKYDFLRTALGLGLTPAQLRGNLQTVVNAMRSRYPNARVVSDDKIDFGDGYGPIDVIIAGDRNFIWAPDHAQDKAAAGPAAGPAGSATSAGPTAPGRPVVPAPAPQWSGYSYNPQSGYQFGYSGGQQQALPPELARFYSTQTQAIQRQQEQQQQIQATMRDALLRMMAQGQEPVDVANDATLGPAAAAYRNAQRREQGRGREALAERFASMGLNSGGQGSGAFEAALQGQDENTRNSIAGYEAQLAVNELQNRRELLVQALQIASALGARTEANDLQRELAGLDAQLRQQQLQYSYAGLGQQQGQFEDTLGYNYAQLVQQANRDALLYGMG